MMAWLLGIVALNELALLMSHFYESGFNNATRDGQRQFASYDVGPTMFWLQCLFSVPLVFHFCFSFLVQPEKVNHLLRFHTLNALLTVFPLFFMGVITLCRLPLINSTPTFTSASAQVAWLAAPRPTIYVPIFLRAWALRARFRDWNMFAKVLPWWLSESLEHLFSLASVMLTCAGMYHAGVMFSDANANLAFFDSVYFTVITFATIGYGESDLIPSTNVSMLVTILMILVALRQFPLFFKHIGDIFASVEEWRTFRAGRLRHVIVAGAIDPDDIELIISEFFMSSGKYSPVHVLVLSTKPLPRETRLHIAKAKGAFADQITLLVGDPEKAQDLKRCDVSRALAVFILCHDRSMPAADSDNFVARWSRAFQLYDHHVPQFLEVQRLLFRSKFSIGGSAALGGALGDAASAPKITVVEKAALRYSLLGLGVVLPGAIPLLVALACSFDSDTGDAAASKRRDNAALQAAAATASTLSALHQRGTAFVQGVVDEITATSEYAEHWLDAALWSFEQECYSFDCPPVLFGLNFIECAAAVRPYAVSLVCVIVNDGSSAGKLLVNPGVGFRATASCRFVGIAVDADNVQAAQRGLEGEVAESAEQLRIQMKASASSSRSPTAGGGRPFRLTDHPTARLLPRVSKFQSATADNNGSIEVTAFEPLYAGLNAQFASGFVRRSTRGGHPDVTANAVRPTVASSTEVPRPHHQHNDRTADLASWLNNAGLIFVSRVASVDRNAPGGTSQGLRSMGFAGDRSSAQPPPTAYLADHFLIIDLRSAQCDTNALSKSEMVSASRDLFTVIRTVKVQQPNASVVLLGRGIATQDLQQQLRSCGEAMHSLYIIEGTGLSQRDLLKCGLEAVRSVLVMSTAPRYCADSDTQALLVSNAVESLVREVHPNPDEVHIVTDVHRLDALALLPPLFSEDEMDERANRYFFLHPSFITGRSLCGVMLDQTLYQAFWTRDAPRVIDVLVSSSGLIQTMKMPETCRTVSDAVEFCFDIGCVLMALRRVIRDVRNRDLDRKRFMILNPRLDDLVSPENDELYILRQL